MKIFLSAIFLFFSFLIGFSQTTDDQLQKSDLQTIDKNELRLNVLTFIAFSGLEGDYEYLMSEESSVGLSLLVGIGNPDDLSEIRNFSITPYYRQFFSKKYAQGFFVEGFAMVLNREFEDFNFEFDTPETRTETNFALGISVGGKFLTRGGFVAEVFGGIGRTLVDNDEFFFDNIIGRGGISLGYRF